MSSDVEEVIRRIDESIQELSRYKLFSQDVRVAIEFLERMKSEVRSLSKEKAQQLLAAVNEMYRQAQNYASFIPRTVENAKFIKEWLEKKVSEL
jgi:hypothetical protein